MLLLVLDERIKGREDLYQKIRKKEFNKRRWYDVLNKDGIMS